MILTCISDIPNKRVASALIGIGKEKFMELLEYFSAALKQIKIEAYENGERKRAAGGGRDGLLDTDEKKLLFILFYLKTYPTFDVLGFLFGMDSGNANSHVHALTPILKRALADMKKLPEDTIKGEEDWKNITSNQKVVIFDGVERECVRARDHETQKMHYSGKKKDIVSKI